jgi:hypothetical protein
MGSFPGNLGSIPSAFTNKQVGQLDSIEINELFFTGLLCALVPAYAAEEIESMIENIKAYVYSATRTG